MKTKLQVNSISRREFLRYGAILSSITFLASIGITRFSRAGNRPVLMATIKNVTLNNGIKMPILGFGTLNLTGTTGEKSIAKAISLGYRLIDTATIYNNEDAVGAAVKRSGIAREELFITSKVWVDDSGYEKTKKAFDTSLKKLGMSYLDLYLIHRPRGDVKGSWQAMEELYLEGKIKAIGVSNFEPYQLNELLATCKIKPAVNQIETHAFFQQPDAHDFLKSNDIQMEAWSPLAQGRNGLFSNETLAIIGKKYKKSNAQISLRWHYQRGIVTIPRTSIETNMAENLNIFDFELSKAEMGIISKLDLNTTQFPEWE